MIPKAALTWLVQHLPQGRCPAEADLEQLCPLAQGRGCDGDADACWIAAAIEATRPARLVEIVVPGEYRPESKRSYQRGKFTRRVDIPEVVALKAKAALAASQVMGDRLPFEEPLHLEMVFETVKPAGYRKEENLPWRRPDLDNLEKPVIDAIDGICFHDDAAFVAKHVRKQFGPKQQTTVRIWPADYNWPYDKREGERP